MASIETVRFSGMPLPLTPRWWSIEDSRTLISLDDETLRLYRISGTSVH